MNENVEMILRKTPLFAGLTEQEMHALTTRASKKHFQRGALPFVESDPCTGLFLMASEKIRIFKLSPAGRENHETMHIAASEAEKEKTAGQWGSLAWMANQLLSGS